MSETKELPPNQMWQHRLLQLDYLPAGELARRFNLLNPRSHPEAQKDATESSLEKVQWIDEVSLSTNGDGPPSLADNPDAVLFDGHERVEIVLARFGPDALVPVKWYRLNKEETDFALLVKDQTTGMAEYIPGKLAELMERTRAMTAGDSRLAGMLERLKQQAGVNGASGNGNGQDDPKIEKAQQLKERWKTQIGQLWQLGNHRLIIGDCTDKATVKQVMGEDKARLVVTDPPYGVSYADKNKFLNVISPANRIETPIENDHATKEQTQAMWKAAFCEMSAVMDVGAVVYCFSPQASNSIRVALVESLIGSGLEPKQDIIWLKNNHVLGRVDYAYKHEPILYAWKEGGHKFYGDFQTSILEYPKPQISDLHPTQKPVSLIERLISNSSLPDEIVYDPFCGSGTTIIAGENLGRRVRAIELDPGYAAVSIQRWVDATNGLTPTLIDQGAR